MLNVSVIVPVLNARRTLPTCLAALERLQPPPAEILLVDNGSADGSLDLLRAFARDRAPERAQVLEEARRGAAAARNAALRVAKGDVIAFTDADCAPEPAWLLHLTEPFTDGTVGAVAGRVVPAPAASVLELFSGLYTLRLPEEGARRRRWTPWEGGHATANLAVRRGLAQALDGFNERLQISGEDHDFCARLYASGATIDYVPRARVAHFHRTTVGGMLRQAFGFGRSHSYLLRRHGGRGLWLEIPGKALRWERCPVRAWVDLASADKKVLAILFLGALYGPALVLLPLYAGWMGRAAARRAGAGGVPVSPAAALGLAGLLVLKSAAMTAGRWWGSVRYGALCL